jgi:hypothetical protein
MWLNEDQWLRFNNQFILKIKKQNFVLFVRTKKNPILFFFSRGSLENMALFYFATMLTRGRLLPNVMSISAFVDVVKLHDGVLIPNRDGRSLGRSTGVAMINEYQTDLLISPLFLPLLFFHSLNISLFCILSRHWLL